MVGFFFRLKLRRSMCVRRKAYNYGRADFNDLPRDIWDTRKKSLNAQKTNNFFSQFSYLWSAITVTCLLTSIICIRDTIISSTHTFMSGPSMNILTYLPYIRSPLTNILCTYCDVRSVFFIISRAFVDMYSARFIMCCQNFVIRGSFSYRLALRSLRLTTCGP